MLAQGINTADLIRAFAVLAGSFILLGIVLGVLRYYLIRRGTDDHTELRTSFTLHDLRTMHEAGELTDEEYEAMRERITRSVRDED
ncbi:SHOCT domain-containing protein [Mucisphaera calidilacus]|nr:SHOCT domain-containing protein [Mucisphaera calidilacus]